jgi:site-specific DNA recombinase
MPQRRERAGRYIRESDERLIIGTTTMESGTKLVDNYCEKQGYICEPDLEWREAISAVTVPYNERKELLAMLDAAKRKKFDVLVIPEIRALARRQVEVLVIYDLLQKYGIRLETVKEKFGNDAMSKAILSLRAMFVEIEVEQSKMRMQRGRADRLIIGQAPNAHPKAAYGLRFINTEKEVKGGYEFNTTIIFVDESGKEWSEYSIVVSIFELFLSGQSIFSICRTLNDLHIPTAKKALKGEPHWQKGAVYHILTNPIYSGEVWANRFKEVRSKKSGKRSVGPRDRSEWILIANCPCPAVLTREQYDAVQKQLQINKEESLRNNAKERQGDIGLLRAGYIVCGICGRKMTLDYPSSAAKANGAGPYYQCEQRVATEPGRGRHRTRIGMHDLDQEAREAIKDVLLHPTWVREQVAQKKQELKAKREKAITEEDIQGTIDGIKKQLANLYKLAAFATDDDTIQELARQMNELELKKRQAEALLFGLDDEREKQEELEKEITKFEQWAEAVKPLLTDPTYTPSYEELRLAVRIIGIKATIFPTKGDYPYRWEIVGTVPDVLKQLDCVMSGPPLRSSSAAAWRASSVG